MYHWLMFAVPVKLISFSCENLRGMHCNLDFSCLVGVMMLQSSICLFTNVTEIIVRFLAILNSKNCDKCTSRLICAHDDNWCQ